jgi:hemolysin-activating ACP:hemolysin acyltransferase
MRENHVNLLNDVTSIRVSRALDTAHMHLAMLTQSLNNNQIKIFKTVGNEPIGYIAWLRLNKESMSLVLKTNSFPPYPYEWSEGKLMLIYDAVFTPGWERSAREKLLEFILMQRFVAFFKRGKVRILNHTGKRKRFLK